MRLGVLASGEGTNLQAILDAQSDKNFPAEVVAVLSDNPEAGALKRAEAKHISTFCVERKDFGSREAHDEAVMQILSENQVELVILAGYMRIVGKAFVERYRNKIMNIHPALLPSFPGLHSVKQALDCGVKVTGVTVHFADEGTDTGPIILQEAVFILENDTEESLTQRVHQVEHRLYPMAIELFATGRLQVEGRRVRIS